jgi:hypothetical protein
MFDFIFFVIVFIVHEAGHYFTFRFMGLKPSIRFIGIFGSVAVGANLINKMSFKQLWIDCLIGVLIGLFPFVFYQNMTLLFLYLIMVSSDIGNVLSIELLNKRYRDLNVVDAMVTQIRDMEKQEN